MEPLVRAGNGDRILLKTKDGEEEIIKQDFLDEHKLGGLIRIESSDFEKIPGAGLFAHFNVERANHIVGKSYGLIRLKRHGYFTPTTGIERLPLLDPEDMRVAECIEYEERIPYEKLSDTYFKYALPHLNSVQALSSSILSRYRQSLPHCTQEEILARGVAYTLLRLKDF